MKCPPLYQKRDIKTLKILILFQQISLNFKLIKNAEDKFT